MHPYSCVFYLCSWKFRLFHRLKLAAPYGRQGGHIMEIHEYLRFTRNLVVLRKASGLSQEAIASAIGICRASYSQLEQGLRHFWFLPYRAGRIDLLRYPGASAKIFYPTESRKGRVTASKALQTTFWKLKRPPSGTSWGTGPTGNP